MKKIIIGGAFLIGGYWLIKNFLNKGFGSVEKPKLEFNPTEDNSVMSLESRELLYQKAMELRDNPKGYLYGWTLFKDDFTEENTKGLRNSQVIKQLQGIKPYSIDYTAINNLGKVGTLDLGFPSEEEMKLAIDKYRTGTPVLPS